MVECDARIWESESWTGHIIVSMRTTKDRILLGMVSPNSYLLYHCCPNSQQLEWESATDVIIHSWWSWEKNCNELHAIDRHKGIWTQNLRKSFCKMTHFPKIFTVGLFYEAQQLAYISQPEHRVCFSGKLTDAIVSAVQFSYQLWMTFTLLT